MLYTVPSCRYCVFPNFWGRQALANNLNKYTATSDEGLLLFTQAQECWDLYILRNMFFAFGKIIKLPDPIRKSSKNLFCLGEG